RRAKQLARPAAAGDEPLTEAQDPGVPIDEGPVEPAQLAVLAVGVVVAELRPADLVAHRDHRHADGQELDREQVPDLTIAQRLDRGAVRRALDAAVPAPVL